ncbi:MAG: hypothetical protein ACE14S_10435 [Candidatus Bathyarchaeia archaeon]
MTSLDSMPKRVFPLSERKKRSKTENEKGCFVVVAEAVRRLGFVFFFFPEVLRSLQLPRLLAGLHACLQFSSAAEGKSNMHSVE